MDIFQSGAWRSPSRAEAFIGGQWRTLAYAEIYIGGAWRRCVTFVQPLTLTAYDAYGYSTNTTSVTSSPANITPVGGLAPYTYSWTLLSGAISIDAPTKANTTFSATVPYNTTKNGTARVTCTDALGSTASATINIYLSSERDTGGL